MLESEKENIDYLYVYTQRRLFFQRYTSSGERNWLKGENWHWGRSGKRLIRQVKFIGKKRRIRQAQSELSKKSLELGVFGLGLLEDGDIGVGVCP